MAERDRKREQLLQAQLNEATAKLAKFENLATRLLDSIDEGGLADICEDGRDLHREVSQLIGRARKIDTLRITVTFHSLEVGPDVDIDNLLVDPKDENGNILRQNESVDEAEEES